MTWFKVDDHFWSHPKVAGCPSGALALWLRGGSWASEHLTDGRVPRTVLAMMESTDKDAAALVERSLWTVTEGGWLFHDWHDHQPTRESVQKRRSEDAERKRSGRETQGHRRDSAQSPSGVPADTERSPSGVPAESAQNPVVPYPTRTRTEEQEQVLAPSVPSAPVSPRKRDPLFDAVTEACGINPAELTRSARGALNTALKALREVHADPLDVPRRADHHRLRWDVPVTPTSLAKHWPMLADPPPAQGREARIAAANRALVDRYADAENDRVVPLRLTAGPA